MTPEQLDRMAEGLRNSPRHQARMVEHNRALAEKNRGDQHWTRRDPDQMRRWKAAMKAGRERLAEGGDAE